MKRFWIVASSAYFIMFSSVGWAEPPTLTLPASIRNKLLPAKSISPLKVNPALMLPVAEPSAQFKKSIYSEGAVYVAGNTTTEVPGCADSEGRFNGSSDVFIAKYDANTGARLWCRHIIGYRGDTLEKFEVIDFSLDARPPDTGWLAVNITREGTLPRGELYKINLSDGFAPWVREFTFNDAIGEIAYCGTELVRVKSVALNSAYNRAGEVFLGGNVLFNPAGASGCNPATVERRYFLSRVAWTGPGTRVFVPSASERGNRVLRDIGVDGWGGFHVTGWTDVAAASSDAPEFNLAKGLRDILYCAHNAYSGARERCRQFGTAQNDEGVRLAVDTVRENFHGPGRTTTTFNVNVFLAGTTEGNLIYEYPSVQDDSRGSGASRDGVLLRMKSGALYPERSTENGVRVEKIYQFGDAEPETILGIGYAHAADSDSVRVTLAGSKEASPGGASTGTVVFLKELSDGYLVHNDATFSMGDSREISLRSGEKIYGPIRDNAENYFAAGNARSTSPYNFLRKYNSGGVEQMNCPLAGCASR